MIMKSDTIIYPWAMMIKFPTHLSHVLQCLDLNGFLIEQVVQSDVYQGSRHWLIVKLFRSLSESSRGKANFPGSAV